MSELTPIHLYVVTLMANDTTGKSWDVEVAAYTAADALTQIEVQQRNHHPGARV